MKQEHASGSQGAQRTEYLTGPQVAERYKICGMTLHRWQKDARLSFPKPMVVNRRKFFKVDDLTAWERERARVSA
ncbi:helix-turn-helix transcriptional regulator [Sinorhizobium fredii]|uniref:helix-turn-helix transcriptional regulator n=1 Tax=Rhizobium fredii TaxID=380 RepID=UPI003514CDA5